MRLDLRNVIHIPDAKAPFQLQVDLSDLEFYGRKPIVRPVQAQGCVTNHAGALVLEGTARSELDLVCDRCGKPFTREKVVELNSLVAQELEDEENDDILLHRAGSGRGGNRSLCPCDGYQKPLLRRLQRAVRRLRGKS